ncbi:MAG: RNA chaperone Hfq [Acidobacteriota bacterium]
MRESDRSGGESLTARRLIRPSISEIADRATLRTASHRKQAPPEQTNAENYYFLKQMQNKTAMVVVLTDGTELRGWIEWYDKDCVKLNRTDGPNLMIYKHSIRYMFKEEELRHHRRRRSRETQSAPKPPATRTAPEE